MLYKLSGGMAGGMRYQKPVKKPRKAPGLGRLNKYHSEGYSDLSLGHVDQHTEPAEITEDGYQPDAFDGVDKAIVQHHLDTLAEEYGMDSTNNVF